VILQGRLAGTNDGCYYAYASSPFAKTLERLLGLDEASSLHSQAFLEGGLKLKAEPF
jgi:hypothetical protein